MNEITKIHLGRQAFTIAADAYTELKRYIAAVGKEVKDPDVVEEIELRMSELLTERKITDNKVVLMKDVDYLKAQLGEPKDFSDEVDDESIERNSDSKKLFRDTDDAIIAGVASGLAKYFDIPTILVRLGFVVLVFITAGWGILVYVLMWLLVPEAKTSSERLLMEGKPVTAKSLKTIVDQADVKGAAKRVNNRVGPIITRIFYLILKIIGIALVTVGLGMIFGYITFAGYFVANHKAWLQNNIFPSNTEQHVLLGAVLVTLTLIAVLIIIFGIAIFRRHWPIKAWVTGVIAGLILLLTAGSIGLASAAYPQVRNDYNNRNLNVTERTLPAFNGVLIGNSWSQSIVPVGSTYGGYRVVLTYHDHPDISKIKTYVKNGKLVIDADSFDGIRHCSTLCWPYDYNLKIYFYAPNAADMIVLPLDTTVAPVKPLPISPAPKADY